MNLKGKEKNSGVEVLFVYATLIYFEVEKGCFKVKRIVFSLPQGSNTFEKYFFSAETESYFEKRICTIN